MLKCPECGTEYNDDLEGCPKCTSEKKSGESKSSEWVHLTTVANDIEYQMVAGLLEMSDIPVVRDAISIEGFIIGIPVAGINIKVPKDKFEEANALLNAKFDEDELEKE